MRATRGLFATLGASGSLVAGGACLLLLASALIAFRGWPSVSDVPGRSPSMLLSSPDAGGHARGARPRPVAAVVVPAVAVGTVARAGRRAGAPAVPARPRRRAAPGAVLSNRVASAPVTSGASSAVAAPAPAPTRSSSAAGTLVRRSTAGAGDTVKQAGDAVAQAAPAAGPPVQQVTTTAAGTVKQAGETAGKAVDGLLGGH